ncbi:unnamed protein product [Periconia digitata]|uniref:Uncharacterized protein n=1 Tax=Periconia digitata TaxID=1303443 RepID=A0A9W4XX96_9PLEO|nr:unnamed protein product [Periconia digitata]
MNKFTFMAFMAILAYVCALPITPAAPRLARRAEGFRLQGLKEHEIAAKLALPTTEIDSSEKLLPQPITLSDWLSTLIRHDNEKEDDDDHSGDIAPGSLAAPEILPHAVKLDTAVFSRILAAVRGKQVENEYGYEGKELELRRPTGMRHWGSHDKWRLF